MKYTVQDIVEFLLPELQIYKVAKEEGFFAKKAYNDVRERRQNIASQTGCKDGSCKNNTQRDINNSPTPTPVTGKRKEELLDAFKGVEIVLGKKWIGEKTSVEEITHAFKRPYVMGFGGAKPRNAMLLIAGESRGKVFAVESIIEILDQRKIVGSAEVAKLDMEKYPTFANEMVFLSDLYQALHSPSEVIVFENIEKGFYQYRNMIIELLAGGKLTLEKRYYLQNNMLVDSTGTLNAEAVSELEARGKYFVFTSTVKQEKVLESLGNKFVSEINDIIVIKDFTNDELYAVIKRLSMQFVKRCKENLNLEITLEQTVADEIHNRYSADVGVKGIQDIFDDVLYKALSEYKLKNMSAEGSVFIKYANGFIAVFGKEDVLLDAYVKNYDAIAVDAVKEELNTIVGLDEVKEYVLELENNLKVQKLREQKGLKTTDLSMHMIFTGNPGTGKTTIARIVAKYLKAIGVLSTGQLIEVTRADLVGQYMGHTATLTTSIIKSALGGVLFIDEAYSLCRDKNDVFGLEAIDALVKGMEDNRDNLIVILAGYEKEMSEFMKTNSGLKSRFPNIVSFKDYTPEEMLKIAEITAKGKGYRIDEDALPLLLTEFEKKQIKGKNDSGNGRLVRNMIESAILNQSQRIAKNSDTDLELLSADDFELVVTKKFDLEEALGEIIGLDNVKEFVRTQYHLILASEKRKKADLQVDTSQSLNMIFAGNPGTGKTTIARVVAKMLHEMGVLKSGQLVEVDKGDLIAEYLGQTAQKTEEVFRSALGGVLFIDEAYAITNDGSSYGQECIDTLVKLIEDYRGELVVILAGYSKEMKEFMKANSGLESRFPFQVEFPDYSAEELYRIGCSMIQKKGFTFAEESQQLFENGVRDLKRRANANSGNGRMVRNYVEQIIRNQSARIAVNDVTVEQMNTILPKDIKQEQEATSSYDVEKDLQKVIGLENVKQYIRSLSARLRVQRERKLAGLKVDATQTMHMIFTGNPGTGKTMMARTVANVLSNMGIIKTNKLVETDRSGLVAGYVGQTALKTREVIESALDGVLFIDEAYALAQGGDNDFGQEAIDTLVKMMDDNRDRLVVILAGYREDMQFFIEQNAGLKSRFANIIEFPDYTTDELMQIALNMYSEQGYTLNEEAKEVLRMKFESARQEQQFGNGRYVRNVYEKSLNNQALRLSTDDDLSKDDLTIIMAEDVREV